jgi:hypothetical protein
MGDWMVPTTEKVFQTAMKAQSDPMSITIDDAYSTASSIVDLVFKNRDSCQFIKVYDDYKNWCLNNMDMCVGSDDGYLERIYDHGYDLFGAFYDLAGIYMFESAPCATDVEFIGINNRLVEDMSSISTVMIGFESDYNTTSEHVSTKNFNEQIGEYFDDLYLTYIESTASQWSFDKYSTPVNGTDYLYEEP